MSKMADLMLEIEEMICAGQPNAQIAKTLNVPLSWVETCEEELLGEELNKQYEMMSYADVSADADAVYYGEM